jgi:predicted PurR-regulated permease PerM
MRRLLFARLEKLWATLLIVTFVVIVIAVPVAFILGQLFQESLHAQSFLRDSIDVRAWPLVAWADKQFDLREIAQQIAATLARWIAPALAHSVGVISQAGVTLLALFFFLRDQESILDAGRRLLPLSPDEIDLLLARMSSAVRSAVYGRLTVGLLQAPSEAWCSAWWDCPRPFSGAP